MNRHSEEFPDIDVPEHFHSGMFEDVSWCKDCCPSFVFKDSKLDDGHCLRVFVDHEDPVQRRLFLSQSTKRYTAVRESEIFESQTIFETDDLQEFFKWGFKSMEYEMNVLARLKIIYKAHSDIGILSRLENPDGCEEEMFQLCHQKSVFILVTHGGHMELREFVNGEDREVDRKYRNNNLIKVLHKINRCKGCGKLLFENECEECNEEN